jgi:hypothetical protein
VRVLLGEGAELSSGGKRDLLFVGEDRDGGAAGEDFEGATPNFLPTSLCR